MTGTKNVLRDLLGLAFITSTVLALFSLMLELLSALAVIGHEEAVADTLFHESFYLLVFIIPPYFLWKLINRPDMLEAQREHQLKLSRIE